MAPEKSKRLITVSAHARPPYLHPDSRGMRDNNFDTIQPSPGLSERGDAAKSMTDVRDFG
jgi:hypothetical protein